MYFIFVLYSIIYFCTLVGEQRMKSRLSSSSKNCATKGFESLIREIFEQTIRLHHLLPRSSWNYDEWWK